MKEDVTKTIIATVGTIIFGRIGIVIIPVSLLLISMIIDYVTGIMAAKYRNQKVSSDIGRRGIMKKLGNAIVIVACLLVDVLIIYGLAVAGVTIEFYFIVTTLVAILIFLNEIISILENIKDMGVHMPKWLLPFIKNIRTKVEEKGEDEVNNIVSQKKEE